MKTLASCLMAAATLAGSASMAMSAPVPFNEPANSSARKIVNVVLDDYIRSRTGVQIAVSVVDVDGDGTGEIVARFVHSGSCKAGMEECRTVVLRYDQDKNWQIILDKTSKQIEVLSGQGMKNRPAPIKTDNITWQWSYPSYKPVLESAGKPIVFKPLPESLIPQIAPAFGAGAAKLAAGHGELTFEYSEPQVAKGQKAILVRMNGLNACGALAGCPMRLLVQNGKSWTPVLQASAETGVALSDVDREGYRDLVLSSKGGIVIMGWNGSAYAVAERLEQSIAEKKR
jgi:hypothetical protein